MGYYPWFPLQKQVEAWQSLVHVCRRWRNLVLGSPRRLNLRLFCTPQTLALDIWPALPLIIVGGGDDMAVSSGTDNIIAALGQSNRVCEVLLKDLVVGQMEKVLGLMQVPFPELTVMRLSSADDCCVIPDSFPGGSAPRLQIFDLDGNAFPGLPNLLLSAPHLVHLGLFNIPHSGYFSPETMVTLISALSSLDSIHLGFKSSQSHPNWESRSLHPQKRCILPALNEFIFKGVTEYLEDLATRIDTPLLGRMGINFFNQIDFDCPRLAQFINRTPMLEALDEAYVRFDDITVSVKLRSRTSTFGPDSPSPSLIPFNNFNSHIPPTSRSIIGPDTRRAHMSGLDIHQTSITGPNNRQTSGPNNLLISISCRESDWQLSSIGQVCNSSESMHRLSTVQDLYINHKHSQLVWKDDAIENSQWSELLLPFTAVKNLYLAKKFAPGVAAALQELVGGRMTEVLPNLQNIFVEDLKPWGPFQENIGQFPMVRRHSGHPIAISIWHSSRPLYTPLTYTVPFPVPSP